MKDKLLINTNPHLRDPELRTKAICRMVETSSAIEGINVTITPMLKANGEYKFSVEHKANHER